MVSYLDTNVVIWLESGMSERISNRAQQQIEETDLLISPIVLLELQLLHELNRIGETPEQILSHLNQLIGLTVCQLPLAVIVKSALAVPWTRDPWDRIIVANALANNTAPLIAADRQIRSLYPNAIW